MPAIYVTNCCTNCSDEVVSFPKTRRSLNASYSLARVVSVGKVSEKLLSIAAVSSWESNNEGYKDGQACLAMSRKECEALIARNVVFKCCVAVSEKEKSPIRA